MGVSRASADLSESGFTGLAGFSGFRFARLGLFTQPKIAPRQMRTSARQSKTRRQNPENPIIPQILILTKCPPTERRHGNIQRRNRDRQPRRTAVRTGGRACGFGGDLRFHPESLLNGLGVKPRSARTFELADGSLIERDFSQTWARLNGENGVISVIFAENAAIPILGSVALATLGLEVDEANERVIPIKARL